MVYSILKTSRLSPDGIREFAERMGEQEKIYSDTGYADIDTLFHNLGGFYRPKDEALSFIIPNAKNISVSLPSMISARRKRYLLAKIIGHYYLHYVAVLEEGMVGVVNSEIPDEINVEANIFASSLMMPTRKFVAAYLENKRFDDWSWKISYVFDVSPAAVVTRLESIDFLNASVYP